MNIHHLELFYYVARHRGISQAVKHMPYGIQQPAVSGQVLQLESDLGVCLFQRRPFSLTSAGEKLFAFIEPFFSGLDDLEMELRGGESQVLRMAAPPIILQDYLPELLNGLREEFPRLRLRLMEGVHYEVLEMFFRGDIDLAVVVEDGRPPQGISSHPLLTLEMALWVPRAGVPKDPEELLHGDHLAHPLISLPEASALTRIFRQELQKRRVEWPVAIQVNSLGLVETYAAHGFGIGLGLMLPGQKLHPKLRSMDLSSFGFPPIQVAIYWRGQPNPLQSVLIESMQKRCAVLLKD